MQRNNKIGNSEIPIGESEYILNPDGSVYHLAIRDEHIANTVILVGDQQRVERVSSYFDRIDHKSHKREFVCHTGEIGSERITVLSSGIGPDNIDIVLNELDAAVNLDPKTRLPKSSHRSLNIIRIGTTGALQPDLPVDSFVISEYGLGIDGVLQYYDFENDEDEKNITTDFIKHTNWPNRFNMPYTVRASQDLYERLKKDCYSGITITAPGFYGPQGRMLRLPVYYENLNDRFTSFRHEDLKITNYEMETSALYGLGAMLGHNCCTMCAVIANRLAKAYSPDYKKTVDVLIRNVLGKLTQSEVIS